MKIPEFKPSRRFLSEYDVPCLVAKIKNSEVGLASRYVAEFRKDPSFKIYLRGRDQKSISLWQRKQLELLFEKSGLATAMAEGLKDSGYGEDVSEEDRPFYEKHGYSPYFRVLNLVIDDFERKVLFLVDDEFHVLHEHLGTIYLKKGRWHFEEYDYYLRYAGAFEKFSFETIKAEQQRKEWQERFDGIFPPPDAKTPITKDCSLLFGKWEPDNAETEKLSQQLGDNFYPRSQCYVFSESYVESLPLHSGRILSLKRQGNWIAVKLRTEIPGASVFQNHESKFWCDGKRLVTTSGDIYRRAAGETQKRCTLEAEVPLSGSERATSLAMDEFHPRLIVSRESALDIVDGIYMVAMQKDFSSLRVRPSLVAAPGVFRLAMIPLEFMQVCWFGALQSQFGLMRREGGEFRTVYTPNTGKSPVTAQFQHAAKELYVFNAGDSSATVYKMANNRDWEDGCKCMETILLPGKPVAATCDSQTGLVYCSLEGRNEIAVIDAKSKKATAVWTVAGKDPCGLAMDTQFRRLFVNCADQQLLMLDGESGKLITSVPTGHGAGVCAFDPKARVVFSIAGDGLLTVARLESPEKLTVLQSLKTQAASHSIALYTKDGLVFLIKDGPKSGAVLLVYSVSDGTQSPVDPLTAIFSKLSK